MLSGMAIRPTKGNRCSEAKEMEERSCRQIFSWWERRRLFTEKGRLWKPQQRHTCSPPLSHIMTVHPYSCPANEIIHLGISTKGGVEGWPLKCSVPWPHGGAVETHSMILLIRAISIKSLRFRERRLPIGVTRMKRKKGREAEVEGFPY